MKKCCFAMVISLMFVASIVSASDSNGEQGEGAATFYTREALFSTRPSDQTTLVQSIDRFGPVGIGIELHQPAFLMKVKNVEDGSPAALTGKLMAGQIIESINGQKLKDIDPRIQLGTIITQAEATDGKVVFEVRDDEEAPVQKVTVNIPVLGAYSPTWPVDCKKSDKIVRNLADQFAQEGWSGNVDLSGPKMLFLLSTGDDKDLDVVREWVKKSIEQNAQFGENRQVYAWFVSWGGPCLAEYYLRTGDETVLPLLKKIADAVRVTMYHDAWGGRGMAGHHMGLAGTGTTTFLLLARQCGVDVDERMLQTALMHFYRFAGKGTNPYMDAHPEVTFTDNGRNARLAFAMAAASALDPAGEESLYAKARDIAAMHSFYSGSYMNHGHTGGGIGEVWRSAAMGLLFDKAPKQYRGFMDNRTWFYDLSRRYDGSFGILGGSSYDKPSWGITMGLTYTAPRKNLCIFGAPRSKFAKDHKIPARAWGTVADDDFLKMSAAPDNKGNVEALDDETFENDSGLPFNRMMSDSEISDSNLLYYVRHPQHMYRSTVAGAIYKDQRFHLIPDLIIDKDARVRYVGVTAMQLPRVSSRPEKCDPGFPLEKMTPEIKSRLFEMLNDPNESWFVVDHVLKLVGRLTADELAPHIDRIIYFLGHDEQWLRHSAVNALTPLALDKRYYKKAIAAMEAKIPNFVRAPSELMAFAKGLNDADPKVQKAGAKVLGRIYALYPGKNGNPPGGLHPQSEQWYLTALANALQDVPGGLDILYEVSKKRYPDAALAHRESFLGASNLTDYSDKLQMAIHQTILDDLIPEYVGKNWKKLHADAAGKETQDAVSTLGGNGFRGGLSELYEKAGINDYSWHGFGPERDKIKYDYYTFEPKEQQKWESSEPRFRPVSLPKGMENWFADDFDVKKAGWSQGFAPFASIDGKLVPQSGCTASFCRCSDQPNTLWEKEVLLLRGKFELPEIKEGYRYRLLLGGRSHVGTGDGYEIYFNGKKMFEAEAGTGRRAGGTPKGYLLSQELAEELSGKQVLVAMKTFLPKHPRSGQKRGYLTLFMEEMKIPPITAELLHKSAQIVPMMCAEWQEMQDPQSTNTDPDEGKYRYDGKFESNKDILGDWEVIDQVDSIDSFVPGENVSKRLRPWFSKICFKDEGMTDTPERIWSGNVLMDLDNFQALKMIVKSIDGKEYLFIEVGGFHVKYGSDWASPLYVLTRI